MSFLMKSIYLIFIFVIVAVLMNKLISLNLSREKEERELSLMEKAYDVLNVLASDERCLAYRESLSFKGKRVNLGIQPVIDLKKLKEFSRDFATIEPRCAKEFSYGYRVKVKTLPFNLSFYKTMEEKGVFSKVLREINGGKVVFAVDVSHSMVDPGGKFCDQAVKKYQCLALFLAGLELDGVKKCTDIGFVDRMSDDSEISVIVYGNVCDYEEGGKPQDNCNKYCNSNCVRIVNKEGCGVERVLDFTVLGDESNRERIKRKLLYEVGDWTMGNTPIGEALESSFEYAVSNNADAIVLLTDGSPTCVGKHLDKSYHYKDAKEQVRKVVEKYKDYGIPVHTITFGITGTDKGLMRWIAEETNGSYFDASTCEELLAGVKKVGEKSIESEEWEFGDIGFSRGESLKDSVRASIPVTVKYDESLLVPGIMEITLYDGELESFVGFVEESCLTGVNGTLEVTFHNPISIRRSENGFEACMDFKGSESCQRIDCEKSIVFPGIEAKGHYIISSFNEGDVLRLSL